MYWQHLVQIDETINLSFLNNSSLVRKHDTNVNYTLYTS
jgi:hypothetical protein